MDGEDADVYLGISPKHHIVFTDGSCFPNDKSKDSRAGYAAVFVSGLYNDMNIYGNLDVSIEYASNIRAEGMAILRTMEKVNESKESIIKLTIITDCEFWVKMIQSYIPKWKKNEYKKKANPDMTIKMWVVYNELKEKGEVKFIHMKSHDKDGWSKYKSGTYERYCYEQNKYADELCGFARTNLNVKDEIFDPIKY